MESECLRANMEPSREEPIACTAFNGNLSYRLHLAPVRTGSPYCRVSEQSETSNYKYQSTTSGDSHSKVRPYFHTAQAMRASLLAKAVAALLCPLASLTFMAQS